MKSAVGQLASPLLLYWREKRAMKTKIYFSQLLMVLILLGESMAVISPKLGQFCPEIAPQKSQLVVTENCDNADECDDEEMSPPV